MSARPTGDRGRKRRVRVRLRTRPRHARRAGDAGRAGPAMRPPAAVQAGALTGRLPYLASARDLAVAGIDPRRRVGGDARPRPAELITIQPANGARPCRRPSSIWCGRPACGRRGRPSRARAGRRRTRTQPAWSGCDRRSPAGPRRGRDRRRPDRHRDRGRARLACTGSRSSSATNGRWSGSTLASRRRRSRCSGASVSASSAAPCSSRSERRPAVAGRFGSQAARRWWLTSSSTRPASPARCRRRSAAAPTPRRTSAWPCPGTTGSGCAATLPGYPHPRYGPINVPHWDTARAAGRHVAAAILGSTAPFQREPYWFSDIGPLRIQHARLRERGPQWQQRDGLTTGLDGRRPPVLRAADERATPARRRQAGCWPPHEPPQPKEHDDGCSPDHRPRPVHRLRRVRRRGRRGRRR